MAALIDGGNTTANVMTVLNYSFAFGDRAKCDFVTDRDSFEAPHLDGLIALHDPTGQHLAFFDSFDDDDADRVLFFMNEKMWSSQLIPPNRS